MILYSKSFVSWQNRWYKATVSKKGVSISLDHCNIKQCRPLCYLSAKFISKRLESINLKYVFHQKNPAFTTESATSLVNLGLTNVRTTDIHPDILLLSSPSSIIRNATASTVRSSASECALQNVSTMSWSDLLDLLTRVMIVYLHVWLRSRVRKSFTVCLVVEKEYLKYVYILIVYNLWRLFNISFFESAYI